MGISSSKHEKEQNDTQIMDSAADQTLGSIGSGASISPFQRLKNLSLSNRYERFSAASAKPQSLSMNNLEGELTPRKITNSGLKQRLIKALGGYNLLDPRSPSQILPRTPLALEKQNEGKEIGFGKKHLVLETSIDLKSGDVEGQDDDGQHEIEDKVASDTEDSIQNTINVSVDIFDGLVISKDPRSPSEGIPRTPVAFAVGTLQTPSIEMQQSFIQQENAKITIQFETIETKQEKFTTHTLIKSIYKDLVRRDPIHQNLLYENETDSEISRTTPIKKPADNMNRTPLSCVANKTHTLRSIEQKKWLGNVFEDNFSPRINPIIIGDENTPRTVEKFDQKVGRKTKTSVRKSNSKIPVIRSRRLH